MDTSPGAVFNAYAEGAFNDFMQNGHPELITKEQYESWVKESLRPEKYQEVVDAFGEFPGNYMVTPDGKLGIARLQFGNVVLLPQNAAGSGDNSFQVVTAPTWLRHTPTLPHTCGCNMASKPMH